MTRGNRNTAGVSDERPADVKVQLKACNLIIMQSGTFIVAFIISDPYGQGECWGPLEEGLMGYRMGRKKGMD